MMKFMYNGIKVNGELHSAHISFSQSIYGDERITVYSRNLNPFPEEVKKAFTVKNDSDMREDYFESDRFSISKGQPFFEEALRAWVLSTEKKISRMEQKLDNPKTKAYLLQGIRSDILWEIKNLDRVKKEYLNV